MLEKTVGFERGQFLPRHCEKCGSFDWRCYDETSRPCWDEQGRQCGDALYGAFVCNNCKHDWVEVERMAPNDCECEDY